MDSGRRSFIAGLGAAGFAAGVPCRSYGQSSPSWLAPDLLAKAKSESGKLVIYSSVNEQEALVLWKRFEDASGIRIEYVRANDTGLLARMAIEARAQQRSWDIVMSTAASRAPAEFLQPLDVPMLKEIPDPPIGANGRSVGYSANINVPAYNTNLVKAEDLPKSYEELAAKKEWAGRVAIDASDVQWLAGMFAHYGEERARKLLADMVTNLKPVLSDGHLALARQVGSGEYAVALNNYVNLTNNVKLGGNPTDYWVMEPTVVFYGQMGISARAPNPNSATLALNFLLSKEAQSLITKQGRVPIRRDVEPNPPDLYQRIGNAKIVRINLDGADEKKWSQLFNEIFKGRR